MEERDVQVAESGERHGQPGGVQAFGPGTQIQPGDAGREVAGVDTRLVDDDLQPVQGRQFAQALGEEGPARRARRFVDQGVEGE